MNNQNLFLILMLLSYSYPIYIVTKNCKKDTTTVSNIICNIENRKIILAFLMMGIFTLFYEYNRKDSVSFVLISILLLGLIGLLNTIDYSIYHLYFAMIAFISIFFFMVYNLVRIPNFILEISVIFQILIGISLFIFLLINNKIKSCLINEEERKKLNLFIPELLLIINFGFFYIYLHYLEFIDSSPDLKRIKQIYFCK